MQKTAIKRKKAHRGVGAVLCTGRSCFLTRKGPCQMGVPALESG